MQGLGKNQRQPQSQTGTPQHERTSNWQAKSKQTFKPELRETEQRDSPGPDAGVKLLYTHTSCFTGLWRKVQNVGIGLSGQVVS